MPLLRDPGQIEKIRKVLSAWPENPRAIRWLDHAQSELYRSLPQISVREVNALLAEHCLGGGAINRVEETQPSLRDMGKECFLEFRINVEGCEVYVKARLMPSERKGEQLYIVSCHEGHVK